MFDLARIYLLVFGILTISGGIMGYVKAKSRASLIAGCIAGALLLIASYLFQTDHAPLGLILGAVVSMALAGRFLPAYLKTRKFMPAGFMTLLSIAGIVISVLTLLRM